MIQSYRDLEVWQMGMQLAEEVYRLVAALPRQEAYGLTAQLQRAAVSIPSNIAEGHARHSTREYLRFVSIAMGSLAELETQLTLAHRLHGAPAQALLEHADSLGRKLRGLRKSLGSKLDAAQDSAPQSPAPGLQTRIS